MSSLSNLGGKSAKNSPVGDGALLNRCLILWQALFDRNHVLNLTKYFCCLNLTGYIHYLNLTKCVCCLSLTRCFYCLNLTVYSYCLNLTKYLCCLHLTKEFYCLNLTKQQQKTEKKWKISEVSRWIVSKQCDRVSAWDLNLALLNKSGILNQFIHDGLL